MKKDTLRARIDALIATLNADASPSDAAATAQTARPARLRVQLQVDQQLQHRLLRAGAVVTLENPALFNRKRMVVVTDTVPARDPSALRLVALPPDGAVPEATTVRRAEWDRAAAFLLESRRHRHRWDE